MKGVLHFIEVDLAFGEQWQLYLWWQPLHVWLEALCAPVDLVPDPPADRDQNEEK